MISNSKAIKQIRSNVELKWNDSFSNITPLITTSTLVLNDMAVGDTAITREGAQISITSLQIAYDVQVRAAGNPVSDPAFRIIYLWDRQPNGAVPNIVTASGVLDNTDITNLTLAPYNHRTSERFRILYDKVHVLPIRAVAIASGTSGNVYQSSIIRKKKIKTKRIVKYSADASGIGSIVTNSLIGFVLGESSVLQGDFAARIYFKDL